MADRVVRHDRAPMKVGATPIEVRANGARIYEGTAAFGDIVKRYPDLDPPRNEFIPAEEAMSPAALASVRGAIFTGGPRAQDWDGRLTLPADHPKDLTTPDTAAGLLEGVVLDGWRYDPPDGGYPELKVRVIAHTRAMQELIESGTCELSLGMTTAEEMKPGIGPRCGTPYQRIQRNVVYDHLNVVGAARSRTPDGRSARLDADGQPAAPPSYPRPGEKPTMDPEVLALIAKSLKMDALSAEDAALLAQMSPEAQAALKTAAMAVDTGAAAGEEAAATVTGEESAEATSVAGLAAMLKTMQADLAALKAAKMDGARLDARDMGSAAAASTARVSDPAAVIAAATQAATNAAQSAGMRAYNDAAKFVGHVRKDGHANVHTTDDAATHMLATVKTHLPVLGSIAEGHVKAMRLDSLVPLYDQAEAIRRADLTRQQGEDVADALNGGAGGSRFDGDSSGDVATMPLFIAPTRASRRS